MKSSEPVKLGFVGAGYMGQLAHIRNYWKLPRVRLAALAEGRRKTAEVVAGTYGIENVYAHHTEMLARADIDAVVAILPFHLNAEVVADALDAGKHVLTEKPQTNTSTTGRRLVEHARRKGRVYQVGYMKRFDPGVRWARDRIRTWTRTGELGRLQSFRIWCGQGDWQWHRRPPLDAGDERPAYEPKLEPKPEWMTDETWSRHRSWTNYFSHQTNLARYVIGEDYRLEAVKCLPSDGRSMPGTFVQCRYERSGAQLYMDFPRHTAAGWDEGFEVVFERAKLTAAVPAPLAAGHVAEVCAYENPAEGEARRVIPCLPPVDGFAAQARQFVASVLGEDEPLSPASEAVKEIEFSESLMRMIQAQERTG